MVPSAYLKVFEPLDALPADERSRWAAYVQREGGVTAQAALDLETRSAVASWAGGAARLAASADGARDRALVRRIGYRTLVCPLELDTRNAVALLAFRDTVAPALAEAVVTQQEARLALRTVEQVDRPPHIQSCTWVVPLHWFAAFAPEDRDLHVDPATGAPRVTYLTSVLAALDRIDRAVSAVEEHIEGAEEVVDALEEIAAWVGAFDDGGVLELDYGSLAPLVGHDLLRTDHSCRDVWRAIEAVEEGDAMTAAASYATARARWTRLRNLEHAS